MQAKLPRWAAADPGRRFDDLFNFVHDPATLIVAFDRVAGNTGSRTPGVDGLTVTDVEERIGVRRFLDDLRTQLKAGSFRPLPVRERTIPKPGGSGKVRRLGIPTVTFIADRPLRSLKAKIRALTPKKSQQDLGSVLRRLNLIMRGWANYFKHAVAKRVFEHLAQFTWRRLVKMMMVRHRWSWKDVRRWLVTPSGSWRPITADGIELFNIASVPVTRYRWRSNIPAPWTLNHA
jgi:hypothetical protein